MHTLTHIHKYAHTKTKFHILAYTHTHVRARSFFLSLSLSLSNANMHTHHFTVNACTRTISQQTHAYSCTYIHLCLFLSTHAHVEFGHSTDYNDIY
uniref:Uncharacterized protein n=1 Tax=Octopus bimaculoides TaxID=37653 RepID=A0A0L8GH73_OCTBM